MSEANKRFFQILLTAVCVGAAAYALGYWVSPWAERATYIIFIIMCFIYQRWLELIIGKEKLEWYLDDRPTSTDSSDRSP